ncbi:MAG: hypothetical protein KDA41_00620 [Planctomycetales bacterium]|nr:hypothetical protein [Planctomycetales bacterium]
MTRRKRAARREEKAAFVPPEDWHEPQEQAADGYQIVVQPPGEGYRHVVTPAEIRARLAELPDWMVEPLQVVQLSRMTRKKQSFPCYGMQWGTTLYLYPLEASLVEQFGRPPKPAQLIEARMYGGVWRQEGRCWSLVWTPSAVRDFYLNNILIHELGHLLDSRNSGYVDRERFAEWFAVQFGYKPSKRRRLAAQGAARVVRRHHG